MKVTLKKSFERDIKKIADKKLAIKVLAHIEKLEICDHLSQIGDLKKMTHDGEYFRIRIGDYRLGFRFENNSIFLLRFLHRKEIYKHFPPN